MYYVGSMAYDPNYLEHHGILGMKWGVRRYQNPDGTYTAAGRARYGAAPLMAVKESKKRLKGLERHHSELSIQRNSTDAKAASTELKLAKLASKRVDRENAGKSVDRVDKKYNKTVQKLEALNTKMDELNKMMETSEAEQWKHIGNLALQGVGTTVSKQTKFYMSKGALATHVLFGLPGDLVRGAMGAPGGDYIDRNKYSFNKTGQITLLNRSNQNPIGFRSIALENRRKALNIVDDAIARKRRS